MAGQSITGNLTVTGLSGTGTKCLHVDNAGLLSVASADCQVGTVTSITTTSPITGGPITTTGAIAINQVTTGQSGYLASSDYKTFLAARSSYIETFQGGL